MPRLQHRRGSRQSNAEPILHSGVLFKRGYGTTPLIGRKSWKPRHFALTKTTLRYFNFENGKLRDEIDLRKCHADSLEIMPSDARKTGRSKSSIWRLALNVPGGRRVLMAAPTEREMNAWIKHLGGVLHDLHTTKAPVLTSPRSASKIDNQREEHEEKKEEDEDDLALLQQLTSRHSDGLEGLVAASWKDTTTDFQNFVAQPRRSMIFRRYSFESRPIVPGVYRNSTGQIDDRELASELAELRKEYVSFHSDGEADEDMTVEEEEALLRALRCFSAVQSERDDLDPMEEKEVDNQREDEQETLLAAPVKPIFHYKKETSPPTSPREEASRPAERASEEDKWFSRFAGKFQRTSKRGVKNFVDHERVIASACTPSVKDNERVHAPQDEDDVPAHLKQDPATSKPRRYSTGSMMMASERETLNPERDSEAEREEALIQELLAGLVYSQYDEKSMSQRDFSSPPLDPSEEDGKRLSGSSDGSQTIIHSSAQQTPTASSGSNGSAGRPSLAYSDMIELLPASAPLIPTTRERAYSRGDEKDVHGDRWLKRLKTKWRSRHDVEKSTKKSVKRGEKEADESPVEETSTVDAVAGTTEARTSDEACVEVEQPREDDDSAEVASVLSDMIANVAILDYESLTPRASEVFLTSPNSTTARVQPRLTRSVTTARAAATVEQESRPKKRGFFRRWSNKLRSNRETRSRRHSTGDMIPDDAIPEATPTDSDRVVEPKQSTEEDRLEEARHFGIKLRRNTNDVQGLVELHEMAGHVSSSQAGETTEATDGDQSDEEIVVVVVRRRHSIDKSVSPPSQKRVTFRVFVDVGDNQDQAESSPVAGQETSLSSGISTKLLDAVMTTSARVPHLLPTPAPSSRVCAV